MSSTSPSLQDIKVPPLGESVREATIARWRKAVGDVVQQDEVLVELETDKVTLEVSAPATGILKNISVPAGSNVLVGTILGNVAVGETAAVSSSTASVDPAVVTMVTTTPPPTAPLSPSVRRLAEEKGLSADDLNALSASGKGGRLTKEDLLTAATQIQSPPSPEPFQQNQRVSDRPIERVKMTRLRARIAERLKMAQNTAAILTTFNEVDMSGIQEIRARYKEAFEKKHGVKLGMMSFFVKAAIQALKEIPAVNAEIDGEDILYKNYYDIGIAVSTPSGLVVPVVRQADQLSFADIEKEIVRLGKRAREGKLTMEDMTGGTFTITNGGIFGSLMATPIINPPQTGILGMHKIQDRPVAIDGKIEIRPMMYLALSYDHRIIDGKESVTFLVRVKENLENPERLLLEI